MLNMQLLRLGISGKRSDELRRKYDPKSNSFSQAHISLSEALKNPLTGIKLQELKAAL